jgi:peptidyl-tRNA hydrolase, PTH1 family
MKIVIGLGNPGPRYKNTRHNAGFLVIEALSRKIGIAVNKKRYKGLFGKGVIGQEPIILFMPETYMNLSGEAVKELLKKSKVEPESFLVIYDDIDLKFGFIRFKESGSHGGHNGLESVIASIGTKTFPRLRIGIGKEEKPEDVSKFVLSSFDSDEKSTLKSIIEKAEDCVLTWIKNGPREAMTRFNKKQSVSGDLR